MNLIEIIFPIILGLTIGITAGSNSTDEPKHIQMLGILTACLIAHPIRMTISILTL